MFWVVVFLPFLLIIFSWGVCSLPTHIYIIIYKSFTDYYYFSLIFMEARAADHKIKSCLWGNQMSIIPWFLNDSDWIQLAGFGAFLTSLINNNAWGFSSPKYKLNVLLEISESIIKLIRPWGMVNKWHDYDFLINNCALAGQTFELEIFSLVAFQYSSTSSWNIS